MLRKNVNTSCKLCLLVDIHRSPDGIVEQAICCNFECSYFANTCTRTYRRLTSRSHGSLLYVGARVVGGAQAADTLQIGARPAHATHAPHAARPVSSQTFRRLLRRRSRGKEQRKEH